MNTFDKNGIFCGADTETPFPVRTNCTPTSDGIKLWREVSAYCFNAIRSMTREPSSSFTLLSAE
jgi:hypothetical protein